MKAKHLVILLLFCTNYSFSQNDRTETRTQVVNLNPGDKNGFLGTVTMVYAFGNCFGDAIMAYGYKDLNITSVEYNGKVYSAKQLGLSNFDEYKIALSRVEAAFSFYYTPVTDKVLTNVLDKYDLGCFGESVTIASKNTEYNKKLNNFSVSFKNAEYSMSLLLSSKIDAFEKKKLETVEYNNLMFEVGKTDNLEDKLQLLKRAVKLAPDSKSKTVTEIHIRNLEEQIAVQNKEADEKSKKEQQSSSIGIVLTSSSSGSAQKTTAPKVSSISSNSKTITSYSHTPTGYNNVSDIMSINNALYRQNFSGIDKAAEHLNSLIGSMMDRKRQQYEARERALAEKRQRIEDEEKREENYYNLADRYIKEMQDIGRKRAKFFTQKQSKPTFNLDGSTFEPIYIIYAYTKKGYDRYYDYAQYPNKMNIKQVIEQASVMFSPVMAVFPFSNGTYPYFEDIKRNILYNYVSIDQSQYDIIFLEAETSVDKIISSLTTNMNNAVYNHEFASAIPSNNDNIIFLNDKIVDSNAKDYWTGGIVEKRATESIDYFQSQDSTQKTKVDYFKSDKTNPTKKLDYWGDTKSKVDSTKAKKPKIKTGN